MNEMETWSSNPSDSSCADMLVDRCVPGEGVLTYIAVCEGSVYLSRELTASLVEYLQKVLDYKDPSEDGWYLIMDSGLRSFALRYRDGAWINSSGNKVTMLDGSTEVVKRIGDL